MAQAKCIKCGARAEGETFEIAAKKINHAIGLSRGIKCGASYDRVIEINQEKPKPKKIKEPSKPSKKQQEKIIETKEESSPTTE